MKILLDETELKLLLEKKKEYIGESVAIESALSVISFVFSVIMATYDDFLSISGQVWKFIWLILGTCFACKAFYNLYKSKKSNYTHDDLLVDINLLNKIEHRHSIVVVKDTFNEYPNRYLVYNDTRWNCIFFINYKTNTKNNEEFIRKHISSDLKISMKDIVLEYVTEQTNEKFSVSNNKLKTYQHTFYLAKVSNMSDMMKKDTFESGGKQYYWKSITELENDEQVVEKNSDVLSIVKSNF